MDLHEIGWKCFLKKLPELPKPSERPPPKKEENQNLETKISRKNPEKNNDYAHIKVVVTCLVGKNFSRQKF